MFLRLERLGDEEDFAFSVGAFLRIQDHEVDWSFKEFGQRKVEEPRANSQPFRNLTPSVISNGTVRHATPSWPLWRRFFLCKLRKERLVNLAS